MDCGLPGAVFQLGRLDALDRQIRCRAVDHLAIDVDGKNGVTRSGIAPRRASRQTEAHRAQAISRRQGEVETFL